MSADSTITAAAAGPVLSEGLGPSCRSETGDVMLCADAACGWLGRCVVAEPMEAGEERDCQHGQLARACNLCADAREIAELRAANERFAARQGWWTERMFELEQDRDTLRRLVHELHEANAAASDGVQFHLLTPRQEFAWRALLDACGPNVLVSRQGGRDE